jgi:hypothetical protein
LFLLVYHQRKSTEKKEKMMFEGTESSIHILQYISTKVFVYQKKKRKRTKKVI